MTIAALIIYIVGFVSESVGGVSVYLTSRRARGLLRSPKSVVVHDNGDGTVTIDGPDVGEFLPAERLALESMALQWWALALLGVGIVCGFVGNVLTLG